MRAINSSTNLDISKTQLLLLYVLVCYAALRLKQFQYSNLIGYVPPFSNPCNERVRERGKPETTSMTRPQRVIT